MVIINLKNQLINDLSVIHILPFHKQRSVRSPFTKDAIPR